MSIDSEIHEEAKRERIRGVNLVKACNVFEKELAKANLLNNPEIQKLLEANKREAARLLLGDTEAALSDIPDQVIDDYVFVKDHGVIEEFHERYVNLMEAKRDPDPNVFAYLLPPVQHMENLADDVIVRLEKEQPEVAQALMDVLFKKLSNESDFFQRVYTSLLINFHHLAVVSPIFNKHREACMEEYDDLTAAAFLKEHGYHPPGYPKEKRS